MNAHGFPIKIYRVSERSMEPALKPGDYIVVSSWPRDFEKGDMVALQHPSKGIVIVKRIGNVDRTRAFLVGDNAHESTDSRHFGKVDMGSIIGKVILKI